MNIKERIDLLVTLKDYLISGDDTLQSAKEKARYENGWFTHEFVDLSIKNIANYFLQKDLLEALINHYKINDNINKKNVGIVMAGNIPLVGFHDFLCVFISGNKAVIKPSSKDSVLIKHIVEKLIEWNTETTQHVQIAENLKNCDAYIATGSNNSSRYFEYYFKKYPNIIRRNRTSVAILEGTETQEQLLLLADDIQQYYGMGCRNITKLFVPADYDFIGLLDALNKYDYFKNFSKYKKNYDYQLALLILNGTFYMSNDSILLTESKNLFAPVSQLNYEFYQHKNLLKEEITTSEEIQCIVGNDFIAFGKTQQPGLYDYADGIDTMQFLKELPQP